MIKKNLPCDYERCPGDGCFKKGSCLRYTANSKNCVRLSYGPSETCLRHNYAAFIANGIPEPKKPSKNIVMNISIWLK